MPSLLADCVLRHQCWDTEDSCLMYVGPRAPSNLKYFWDKGIGVGINGKMHLILYMLLIVPKEGHSSEEHIVFPH